MAGLGTSLLFISLLLSWFLYFIHWKRNPLTAKFYIKIKQFAVLSSLFLWIPMLILVYAFVTRDYSFVVVYQNSDNSMNLFDRIMATWAARAGSMLLWAVLQSTITIFALYFLDKSYANIIEKRAVSILLFFNALITTFALSVRNPVTFETQNASEISDGLGLVPSLLNFWQQIHPPVAFLSYSAFIVPYAIAISGLVKKPDEELSERSFWLLDFFMLLGWVFTTIFIISGAIWSYEVDWGGFWFFDSVQTSSLILWIMASLYFHAKPLMNKHHPFHLFLASLGWVGVTLAAFIVRGGYLEGPHTYAGNAQRIVFSLLLLGTVAALILSSLKSKEDVIPDWLFSLKKSSNNYSLLTLWVLVLIVIINTTSVTMQIVYAQMSLALGDLTSYYRIINGTLLTLLGFLLVLCENNRLKMSSNSLLSLTGIGMSITILWSWFQLPEFRLFSFLLLLAMGTFVIIQLGNIVFSLARKNLRNKVGIRITHFVILLTLFSFTVTDPQTISVTTDLTLDEAVAIPDLDLVVTLTEVDSGNVSNNIPSTVSIMVEDLDRSNIGTVRLVQGTYLGSSTWSKGDWIIQHSHDIYIKLADINQLLFIQAISTVSIIIKIIPGVNIFRLNILLFTLAGILGIWTVGKKKPVS
ncbi:MAG: cytochrome c biogenesis protein CcsA [Candidatus Kariarchaeaceae archaeon]